VRFALDPGSGVLADTIATTDAAGVAPLPGWTVVGGWSVLRATGAGGVVRVAARADPPFDATNFVATLTGAERVPPIATPATGLANLTFTGVAITYNVDVSNVSGVVRVMLHVGSPGATGPVALALCGEATAPACASGPGVITAGSSAAPIGITLPVLVDSLRRQQTYIRVATTTHPAGLIRGQVLSVFP
jgi:hypothetical protein